MQRLHSARQAGDVPLLTEQEIADLLGASRPVDFPAVRRSPDTGRPGGQLSPSAGAGTDFAEPRVYQPGDDPRHIDWRATARSRVPLVRSYHAEFSRPVCVVIDRRAAMRFGTRVRLKVTQAVRAGIWLAGQEVRAGRELAAVLLDDPCEWLPPARGRHALRRLAGRAVAACPPRDPGPGEPGWGRVLAGLRRRLARGTVLILVSDFTGLGEDEVGLLRALGRYCECRAIRIIDAVERGPMPRAEVRLSWGGMRSAFDPADPTRSAAQSGRLDAWSAFLAGEFRRAGIPCRTLAVDADVPGDLARATMR